DIILVELHCFYLHFMLFDTLKSGLCTLSLHDALPISLGEAGPERVAAPPPVAVEKAALLILDREWHCLQHLARRKEARPIGIAADRKSTRLNSSHVKISYAVFCLKKQILIYTYVLK